MVFMNRYIDEPGMILPSLPGFIERMKNEIYRQVHTSEMSIDSAAHILDIETVKVKSRVIEKYGSINQK